MAEQRNTCFALPPPVEVQNAAKRGHTCFVRIGAPEVGKACLNLPFDLSLCRLVWLGVHFGCAADGVILACSLAVQETPKWHGTRGLRAGPFWSDSDGGKDGHDGHRPQFFN